ncbi:MAG: AMP-binding protein [Desulfobacteraceae bacterium]|nr:AMP-binding protein [Desulfobacteraceae bacterium]
MAEHSVDEKYWSGGLECAPRDEIRALQEEKLKEQAEYIYAHSRFWRGQFERAKMRPEDIRTIEDLAKVPYMHKEVHTAHLEKEGSIFGGLLCRPLEDVYRRGAKLLSTSGTTAKPRRFILDREEWETYADASARVVWAAGIRPGDVAFLPFPLTLWTAGWVFQLAFDKIGVTSITAGPPFDTRQRFGLIEDFKPTVTVTTPSYILHMAATAREMGIDLKSLGLKFILIGGEPCPDASKKRIEELFDLPGGTRNFMGISELSPPCICGIECEEQDGFHTTSEDTMIYQFLKPDSSEPAKPGEESELVLTSLVQRTLITGFNFRTRDLCIYDDTPCKCGRTSPRFRIIGRHDDMVSISGVNIFASLIEDIVRKIPELGDEFQLVIENRGELSKVTVKVEPQPDTDPTRHPELKKKLEGAITDALTIKLPVEFVEFGSLPRFELKAKRWLDLRKTRGSHPSYIEARTFNPS